MGKIIKTVKAYGVQRAKKYDNESRLIRGARELHRRYLLDLLTFVKSEQSIFLELGCGTGYFTEVFFEVFPEIAGVAIDGSEAMLRIVKDKFKGRPVKITFQCALFNVLDWESISSNIDIIFSSLAIHHLDDRQKWCLFENIYNKLSPQGIFILFDSFRPKDKRADELLEFMTCMDIKHRVEAEFGQSPPINKIIKKDRELKQSEGDKEASLDDHFKHLELIGFKSVTTVFREARLAGIVAYKT